LILAVAAAAMGDDFDETGRRLAESQLLLNKSFVGAVQRCTDALSVAKLASEAH